MARDTRKQQAGKLPHLKLEDELGPRGVGKARRALDPDTRQALVVTVIDPDAVANSKSRRYFKRHLEHLQMIKHPGVGEIIEAGTDDGEGRGYLLEPLTEGRSLRSIIAQQGALPARDALAIAQDVLNGLSALHHHGLVHGSLSPDGIWVRTTPEGPRAQIIHAGFQRIVGEEQETPVGPVRVDGDYAAPEMVKSEAADARADVYSAGIVLHEMLCGQHPIPAPPKTRLLHRLNETAPPLPANTIKDAAWDESVRAAIRAATAKNPAMRFPSARAFAQALRPGAPATSEPHPIVAAAGGACTATGAAIKPAAERTWSRTESDAPFICPVTQQLFAGRAQWDARALASKGAVDRPIPPAAGAPPADVTLDLSALTREPAKAPEPAKPAPVAVVKPAEPAKPATPAPVRAPEPAAAAKPAEAKPGDKKDTKNLTEERRDALRNLLEQRNAGAEDKRALGDARDQAWESERQRSQEARERHETSRLAAAGPAKGEVIPTALPAGAPISAGKPAESFAATRPVASEGGSDIGWKILTAGLVLVLGFVLLTWRDQKRSWTRESGALAAQVAAADSKARSNATRSAELEDQVKDVGKREEQVRKERTDLEVRLREATERHTQHEQVHADLEQKLARATQVGETLGGQKTQLEQQLGVVSKTKAELEAERAALTARLSEASAGREAVERRLREVEAEQARVETERRAAQARLDEVARSAAAAEARRSELAQSLQTATARMAEQSMELEDLQLQLVTASRGHAALLEEKRGLEADLAEAQEALRAQQDLLALGPETRVALYLRDLAPDGRSELSQGARVATDDTAVVVSRTLLAIELEAARPLLERAARDEVLLAVHVALDGEPDLALRLHGRRVPTVGGAPVPLDRPGVLHPVAQEVDGGLVRFWIDAADAARYLEGASTPAEGLVFVLEPDPARLVSSAGRQVVAAELVATPLAEDVALRLREARAQ